jgi:putative Ca2+/H+ antiporter (TMEM165/GDT1 family)
MHPETDLFALVAMVLTHIRKKAFQVFTQNYLPSLFIRIILALPWITRVSLRFFPPQWRQLFGKMLFLCLVVSTGVSSDGE